MQYKIVIVLKSMQLSSYSSRLAIPSSLSSSCLNHNWSMHSVHLLPYLSIEGSIFACLSQITST